MAFTGLFKISKQTFGKTDNRHHVKIIGKPRYNTKTISLTSQEKPVENAGSLPKGVGKRVFAISGMY
jgi:hypothetical protein